MRKQQSLRQRSGDMACARAPTSRPGLDHWHVLFLDRLVVSNVAGRLSAGMLRCSGMISKHWVANDIAPD